MGKFKAIIYFLFIDLPFYIVGGLELTIRFNKRITDHCWETKNIINKRKRKPKPRKPTDKQIFLDFMARNT